MYAPLHAFHTPTLDRGSSPQGSQILKTVSSEMCDGPSDYRPYYRPHYEKDSSESHASCWIVMVYRKL